MAATQDTGQWIWGFHSVEAALQQCPELVVDLQVEAEFFEQAADTKNTSRRNQDANTAKLASILSLAKESGLKAKPVPKLPGFLAEKRSQGVVAKLKKFPSLLFKDYEAELKEILEEPLAPGRPLFQWAILDGVQDPRNYGAILRSAAAFGVKAVFVRDRNQCPLTGVVAQASAGNLFRTTIVTCVNFAPIVDLFADHAAVVLGLEASNKSVESVLSKNQTHRLWILGGEGEGIRSALRERCTELVALPMEEGVESLNASAAATLAFYLGRQNQSSMR